MATGYMKQLRADTMTEQEAQVLFRQGEGQVGRKLLEQDAQIRELEAQRANIDGDDSVIAELIDARNCVSY